MLIIRKFLLFLLIGLLIILFVPIQPSTVISDFVKPANEKIDQLVDGKTNETTLKTPEQQVFAMRNIQMNMTKKQVEAKLGQPVSKIGNEYGTRWYVYHHDFNEFVMVSFINDKVHGLYTNQNLITSKNGIKYGSPKDFVREKLGTPVDEIKKGHTIYKKEQQDYDIFDKDGIYTTAFYDKYDNHQLMGLMQISHTMENKLNAQYAAPSKFLSDSFEKGDYNLLNATRVQKGLKPLAYSDSLAQTARKHSTDMAKNHYFDHNDLSGKTPFDRIKADGHQYQVAAENLAYGQTSPIYAHHGLMNSKGHRKNILNRSVKTIGIGVDFNSDRQPFFTENYIG
ncbi:CAP-associated domain-containing protein [Staphylococcus coagulans]|uniref:CAP domain-containing protein n=1 Tax=Staphylococcus coagulans TaxID=74706 RepID=UPI003364DE42